jgi:hypothetical protein
MTLRLLNSMAQTATRGERRPDIATGMRMALWRKVRTRFRRILRLTARLKSRNSVIWAVAVPQLHFEQAIDKRRTIM